MSRLPPYSTTPIYGATDEVEKAWLHLHAVGRLMAQELQQYPLGTIAILDKETVVCYLTQANNEEHIVMVPVIEGMLLMQQAGLLQEMKGLSVEELQDYREMMKNWMLGQIPDSIMRMRYNDLPSPSVPITAVVA